jgi:hypothetical protein
MTGAVRKDQKSKGKNQNDKSSFKKTIAAGTSALLIFDL